MLTKKLSWVLFHTSMLALLALHIFWAEAVYQPSLWTLFVIPSMCLITLFPNWRIVFSITTLSVISNILFHLNKNLYDLGNIISLSGYLIIWISTAFFQIEISKKTKELERLTFTDSLTKSYNRRYLDMYLLRNLPIYQRTTDNLSVIAVDIDHFKKINDTYGHPFGDSVLINTVRIVQDSLRQMDFVARIGGEEFLIVLPHTTEAEAKKIAEQIVDLIHHTPILSHKLAVTITISAGVTTFIKTENFNSLIHRVDTILYRAKRLGRNRVEVG
jgi:diguanylate cyclase (GGDEF)-like protein